MLLFCTMAMSSFLLTDVAAYVHRLAMMVADVAARSSDMNSRLMSSKLGMEKNERWCWEGDRSVVEELLRELAELREVRSPRGCGEERGAVRLGVDIRLKCGLR